jgi:mRNA interferase RelE/StbE
MTAWTVDYTDRAKKDLHRLERVDAQRIIRAIHSMKENPRGHVEKLRTSTAAAPIYSFHVGHFRVLLEIVDARLLVLVLEVRHRKTSYRDF